jgi:hypothetical protein
MSRRRRTASLRPFVEVLEGRWVPTTLTPTTFLDGGLGSGSLRDAVLQLNADTGTDDDIIQLQAGTYTLTIQNVGGRHETAGLTGDLNLTQASHRWIIQGAGSSGDQATIIDGSQLQDRVFDVNPFIQVVFQHLVLQGGLAQENGADGAVAGTTDALGGGLLNNGGRVALTDVVVQNNQAQGGDAAELFLRGQSARGGGIYSAGGALTLAGATLANNQVIGGLGGAADTPPHHAGEGGDGLGGGLYATGGALDISDSLVASNHATGGRGGDGFCTSTTCYGGQGGVGQGGGLYASGGPLTLATSTLATNQATAGTGGRDGLIGSSLGGGLVNAPGSLTVSNSTLSGNTASGSGFDYGGGIVNFAFGTLTVMGSTLSGNSASSFGGGLVNYGTLTVSNSTLSGNSAISGGGGGIYSPGQLTVMGSTLSGNSASSFGGGIDNGGINNGATLTVSNSTLSGNSAISGGGGIATFLGATVTLTNVTLTDNRATLDGGGLEVFSAPPVLHNTLIARNFHGPTGTTPDDVFGQLDPGGDNNLIGDGTGMTGLSNGVNGNQVGTASDPIDPLLGPLADNGGPTLTHALLSGSPAIDGGNNTYATDWDQRGPGYPRITDDDPVVDIGAFEVQSDGSGPTALRVN